MKTTRSERGFEALKGAISRPTAARPKTIDGMAVVVMLRHSAAIWLAVCDRGGEEWWEPRWVVVAWHEWLDRTASDRKDFETEDEAKAFAYDRARKG